MGDNQARPRSDADADLEREIREGRKFTLEEAIGRMVGPGAMKGESPIARLQQAETEIGSWLQCHLKDAGGALDVVLHRRIKESDLLLNNFNRPLTVLAAYCRKLLDSDYLLKELVRDCDVEWGRVMDERPYFQKAGAAPNPDDPYTVDSVCNLLCGILSQLAGNVENEAFQASLDSLLRPE
jgi:hypothetical protein